MFEGGIGEKGVGRSDQSLVTSPAASLGSSPCLSLPEPLPLRGLRSNGFWLQEFHLGLSTRWEELGFCCVQGHVWLLPLDEPTVGGCWSI